MMQDLEQTIRERAYHLWVESGRNEGEADAHWLAAQREILRASLSSFGRVTATEQPKASKGVPSSKQRRRAA
jgi:hypothetical protein